MRPAIVYAAKSTYDPKGSIQTQLADGRDLAAAADLDVCGEFADENASGYHGNRGSQLAMAKDLAEQLVAEHGECALVVQHSDRLARGDGQRAAHLLEYALWALKTGVTIRSKQNPEAFANLVYSALAGDQAHAESRRKRDAVRDGLERRAQKGLPSGTRTYGYRYRADGEGLDIDTFEAGIVRRVYREFLAGRGLTHIARGLNQDGVRTSKGKMWRQSTVGGMLANPFYLGLLQRHEQWTWGKHEAIVEQATWADVAVLRAARPSQGRGRMPKGNHLFRKGLLRCECGEALTPRTNYNGHQVYVCVGKQINGRDFCDMPHLWRSTIDTSVFNYFTQVGLDLDATREAFMSSSVRKLGEVDSLLGEAQREAQRAEERYARVRRDYANGDITAAEWREFRDELTGERDAAQAQAARLRASRADIASRTEELDLEHDALRQLAEIRRSIAGDIQAAEGVEAVRAALMRLFDAFVVHRSTPDRVHVELIGEYWIEPIVRGEMLGECGPSRLPRPRRQRLDLGCATNNTMVGAGEPSGPCAPTGTAVGARATASASPQGASASARWCRTRARSPSRRVARPACTSSCPDRRRRCAQPSAGLGAVSGRCRISVTISCSIRAICAIRSGGTPASCAARTQLSSAAIARRTASKPAASWRSCGRSRPA